MTDRERREHAQTALVAATYFAAPSMLTLAIVDDSPLCIILAIAILVCARIGLWLDRGDP